MELSYQNLVIRNATAEDSVQLANWWNDGKVMAHAGFPNGLGTTPEKITDSIRKDSDEAGRRLIIEESGVPIGEMSYRTVCSKTAEIGIKICEFSKQEKGYGKILLSMRGLRIV
ncbi:MAG: GNAT family N-acetyltransferase [Lachnospiraceae bacterium]|nr:GNAT family N-acetyltransferase [Lachnospiraceae bacterium]